MDNSVEEPEPRREPAPSNVENEPVFSEDQPTSPSTSDRAGAALEQPPGTAGLATRGADKVQPQPGPEPESHIQPGLQSNGHAIDLVSPSSQPDIDGPQSPVAAPSHLRAEKGAAADGGVDGKCVMQSSRSRSRSRSTSNERREDQQPHESDPNLGRDARGHDNHHKGTSSPQAGDSRRRSRSRSRSRSTSRERKRQSTPRPLSSCKGASPVRSPQQHPRPTPPLSPRKVVVHESTLVSLQPCASPGTRPATSDALPTPPPPAKLRAKAGPVVFGAARAKGMRPYMEDRHVTVAAFAPMTSSRTPVHDDVLRSFAAVYDG